MSLILFAIGSSFASFITLCAQRLTINQRPWLPKWSYCDHCQKKLAWWQLIPVLGYCLQGGQCPICHHRITIYFPVVELLTGFSFAFLLTASPFHDLVLVIFLLTLVFISTTDYFAQYVYPVAYSGLFPLLLITTPNILSNLLWTLGISLVLIFLSERTNTLGSGDVEFIIILCIILGGFNTCIILQISSLIMLACFFISPRQRLPFIPALSLATYLILFYQQY